MTTKVEFAVQFTCESCVEKVRKKLESLPNISNIDINFKEGTVTLDTTANVDTLQTAIEETGRRAVVKGLGYQGAAAVAMLGSSCGVGEGELIKGVVRFLQASPQNCVIDGTIDGLTPGNHGIHIYEYGDLSGGCDNLGKHLDLHNSGIHGGPESIPEKRHTGDLGNILADETGRAKFRLIDHVIQVHDLIGRSLGVTRDPDDLGVSGKEDGASGPVLSCGIIARSAGLFENSKRICACDGVTLWEERDRPLVGPGRRQPLLSNI